MNGKLIAICGIDGSGKSSLHKRMKDSNNDNRIVYTKPTISKVFSRELYELAKMQDVRPINQWTDLLTITSEVFVRTVYMNDLIYDTFNSTIPLLEQGTSVVLDRYAICEKVFLEALENRAYHPLSRMLKVLPTPDLIIYLDVDVTVAFDRIRERKLKIQPHEQPRLLSALKDKCDELLKEGNFNVVRIDANQSIDVVYNSAVQAVDFITSKKGQ
jgi:thymidylate kinase